MTCKRRKQGLLCLATVMAVGALVVVYCLCPKEPTHDGKRLSYWFHEMPLVVAYGLPLPHEAAIMRQYNRFDIGKHYGAHHETPAAVFRAVRTLGTNAFPYIFAKLARREFPLQKAIEHWAGKCGIRHSPFEDRLAERAQATMALLCLSPLPPYALNQLHRLTKNKDDQIAAAAKYVLTTSTDEARIAFVLRCTEP